MLCPRTCFEYLIQGSIIFETQSRTDTSNAMSFDFTMNSSVVSFMWYVNQVPNPLRNWILGNRPRCVLSMYEQSFRWSLKVFCPFPIGFETSHWAKVRPFALVVFGNTRNPKCTKTAVVLRRVLSFGYKRWNGFQQYFCPILIMTKILQNCMNLANSLCWS